jgi:glycosidase
MQGKGTTSALLASHQQISDIDPHMLKFLENHDEQRIASPEFAGNAEKGKPAMVVSALIGTAPTMLYFGQEVGEAGALASGFGQPSRTTIFDYAGVPAHQGWLNGGKYDGGNLTPAQRELREFYRTLLHFSATAPALRGQFFSLHQHHLQTPGYSEQTLAFARSDARQRLIVVANFAETAARFKLQLPAELVQQWQLAPGQVPLTELFSDHAYSLQVDSGVAVLPLTVKANSAIVLLLP